MSRFCQLVIGPAGCGKSTYCEIMQKHYAVCRRVVDVINLDPAAESFNYTPAIDIRDLVSLEDVMESDLNLGPNGGLVYCMEYLQGDFQWLKEQIDELNPTYIIIDCPGQIELYTQYNFMKSLVTELTSWDFNVCCVHILDSKFLLNQYHLVGGMMTSHSAMFRIGDVPMLIAVSKMDLLDKRTRSRILDLVDFEFLDEMIDDIEVTRSNKRRIEMMKAWLSIRNEARSTDILPINHRNEKTIIHIANKIEEIFGFAESEEHMDERDIEYVDLDGEVDLS